MTTRSDDGQRSDDAGKTSDWFSLKRSRRPGGPEIDASTRRNAGVAKPVGSLNRSSSSRTTSRNAFPDVAPCSSAALRAAFDARLTRCNVDRSSSCCSASGSSRTARARGLMAAAYARSVCEYRGVRRLVVDGMNVIGSRPDGWWRDRDGAVRRLLARLPERASDSGDDVTLVLDGRPLPDVPDGDHGGVHVGYATRRGRNVADDPIVGLGAADPDPGSITVVPSDREPGQRVRALGAVVSG